MTLTPRSAPHREWPPLPLDAWRATHDTLHAILQIVGKVRLALAPPVNHWWHTTLYPTVRGLTTLPMPDAERLLQIDADFLDHVLRFTTDDGQARALPLTSRPVADHHAEIMDTLRDLGVDVRVRTMPVEMEDPVPFDEDQRHATYDPAAVERFHAALLHATRALERYRGRFIGKSSPTHFFWGALDLAVTRFSGREAPPHPGAPGLPLAVVREAYSHEVASAGWWPGGGPVDGPAFYAYAYPEPDGYRDAPVEPAAARYDDGLREFVLPCDALDAFADPDAAVDAFLETTYAAAATLAHWDRDALER